MKYFVSYIYKNDRFLTREEAEAALEGGDNG